jgi:group I intron endonuclease
VDDLEKNYIAHYKQINPDNIYNIALGGIKEKTHSYETKQKISKAMTGKNNPMFGKRHTDEIKRLLSKMRMGKSIPHTDETKKKISESLKKVYYRPGLEKSHIGKPVQSFDPKTDVLIAEYSSISSAARAMDTWAGQICGCCRGKHQTAAGFKWKYKQ